MNRPQYFWPTPPGYQDVPWVRPVTVNQDPNGIIPAGGYLSYYVITLDNDLPMLIRSLFIEGAQQAAASGLQIQLRDAFGNFLTDGYVPLWLYATGAGSTPPDGGSGRAKVFEPELYCPPGSVLIADFFNPGSTDVSLLPSFALPVSMSASHPAIAMRVYEPGGSGQGAPMIKYNGVFYQVLQYVAPPYPAGRGSINVFQSTDLIHWTIVDGPDSPQHSPSFGQPSGGVFYDGNHTLTVASTLGELSAALAQPILLQDFNLQTGSWGPVYGAGSANVYQTNQVWKRADGSTLVIAGTTLSGGSLSNLRAEVLSAAGAWSSFNLVGFLPAGWTTVGNSMCVLDPSTQIIHMFGTANSAGPLRHLYYQQILPNNTVTGFQDLTALGPSSGTSNALPCPVNPLLVAGNIVLGYPDPTDTFATVIVGTPIANPVFTSAPAPGVNPQQVIPASSGAQSTLCPYLQTDGVNLWAVFINEVAEVQVWLSVTQNLTNPATGWVGGLAYDDLGGVLAGSGQYPTMGIIGGLPYITIEAGGGNNTEFVLAPIVSGASAQFPPYMEFRGIKRGQVGCA